MILQVMRPPLCLLLSDGYSSDADIRRMILLQDLSVHVAVSSRFR